MRILHFTTAAGKQPVELFINQEERKAQAKIHAVISFFQEYGFHLPDQYLRKMTGTHNLWELRTKYQNKQFRIFLAKIDNDTAVLLHAIVKKTRKTPVQDIRIAQARLKSMKLAEKG